jgi:hypothetical protein
MSSPPRLLTRDELGDVLNQQGLVGAGVEVGVFRGEFSEQVLIKWHGKKLYLVDPWAFQSDYLDSWGGSDDAMERLLHCTLNRLHRFRARIDVIRKRSDQAALRFADAVLDFVYIDANHSFSAVANDLQLWYPKIRTGGLLAGHDYFDARADENLEPIRGQQPISIPPGELTSYGVKSAVDEFVRKRELELHTTGERLPTWYVWKTD